MCVFIAWIGLRSQVQKTAWGYMPLSTMNLIKGKIQTDTEKNNFSYKKQNCLDERGAKFSILPYTTPNFHLLPIVRRGNIDYKI